MKINSKKVIITIMFLLVLVLLIGGAVYFYSAKNSLPEKQEEKLDRKIKYCLADNEVASYEIKGEDLIDSEASVTIFVKNQNTNSEKYNFKIENIRKNYHPVEIHKCGIYVIRMFNYDPKKSKQDTEYREELWRYDYSGKGEMIILLAEKPKEFISYYSTDFRVDPTEKYIALTRGYLGKENYALVIKNLETKEDDFVFPFKEIIDEHPDLVGSMRLDGWSDDGRYFWFDTHAGAMRLGFVRIDALTWKTDIFPAPKDVLGGDALNFDTGYITVHPGNIWFGVHELTQEEKEERRKKGIGTELYVESLITKERHFVDKTDEPLWFFKPEWISETELEYYLPSGEKRVYEISKSQAEDFLDPEEKIVDFDCKDYKIDIADWKTYKSDKRHYQIKYPKEATAAVISSGDIRLPSEDLLISETININLSLSGISETIMSSYLSINVIENPKKLSGEEWVAEMIAKSKKEYDAGGYPYAWDPTEKESILINDVPAYRIVTFGFDGHYEDVYISGGEFMYKLGDYPIAKENPNYPCSAELYKVYTAIISTFEFIEKDEEDFSCGDSIVTDIDSNIYSTVKIGDQCWMKENLKVTKNPAGESIARYCLNNSASSCNNDGGLYDWDTAMNNLIKEGAQGICPNGWHIPKDSEWFVLENYLKDEGQTCSQSRTGWGCDSVSTKIRIKGSSGFEAPFTGYRDIDKYGTIHSWGSYTGFWSSSVYGGEAWYRFIRSDESRILRTTTNRKYGHAVRCLRNSDFKKDN